MSKRSQVINHDDISEIETKNETNYVPAQEFRYDNVYNKREEAYRTTQITKILQSPEQPERRFKTIDQGNY